MTLERQTQTATTTVKLGIPLTKEAIWSMQYPGEADEADNGGQVPAVGVAPDPDARRHDARVFGLRAGLTPRQARGFSHFVGDMGEGTFEAEAPIPYLYLLWLDPDAG